MALTHFSGVDAGTLRVNGVTSSVAVAAGVLELPVTASYIDKTTGGAETLTIPNGVEGQVLTVVLAIDGGTGTIIPDNRSGFSSVVMADVKDHVTFKYIDDTVGWTIIGTAGVVAPPVIS